MDLLPKKIKQYVENNSSTENSLLKEIARDTYLHVLNPRMLSGHYQGRLLSFLSHMIQPRQILEIGTFTGYATLCLAEGLASDGMITTIDINEEITERAKAHFSKSRFNHQIIIKTGDAFKIIPKLETFWDLVFIDADKENYINYFKQSLKLKSKKGIILIDNTLWKGDVANPKIKDKLTIKLREFNKYIKKSPINKYILPIGDGFTVCW